MKIRVAFYKYIKKPVNFGIAAWTWLPNIGTPPYSHCEIGFEINGEWKYFSSTMRDGAKGTRWATEKEIFKHPKRWDVYEFEAGNTVQMIQRAHEIKGNKYDVLGLTGFVIPFGGFNKKKKWYCSEACYYILIGLWKLVFSPRRFFRYVNKNFDMRRVFIRMYVCNS